MKEHDTNLPEDIARFEPEGSDRRMSDHFDPARVFAEPVAYLAGLGLQSELVEMHHHGFPAAA